MDIFNRQLAIVSEYELLYKPIEGGMKENPTPHTPVETPLDTLERINGLKEAFTELKEDMQHELDAMNSRLIVPATDAKDSIQAMKKTIKKREDRKVRHATRIRLLRLQTADQYTSWTTSVTRAGLRN